MQAEYTVLNVETTLALFRANTPTEEILHMVVPANLLFVGNSYFIFHTMQSFKQHLSTIY